jgi:hypothetical protein
MDRRTDWFKFLKINGDGWSSEFQSVDLLLKHLGRKSRSIASRDGYCYILYKVCTKLHVNPDELISKGQEKPDALAFLIQGIGDEYHAKGSTRYANQIVRLINSFFKVNKVELDLHGYFQPMRSRKRPEYVPTLKEALRMADVAGSWRNRLIIQFLTYTGLRNSTLRALVYNESYPDLLLQEYTIKKELERNEQCILIIVHEIMKNHIQNACKNRTFCYTFIPPKVAECLRLYIREREEKYGSILDDEPIFVTENRRIHLSERRKTPISARELQDIVKNAAKRAGIKYGEHVYPHCLRKTYEGFLRNQPDDVRLDVKEREFLFGHTLPGSQDTYFDNTKIEEMRGKYAKMNFEPILSVDKEDRVIEEEELASYLQKGWHYVANTPSGKVVVYRKTVVKEPVEVNSPRNAQSPPNTTVKNEKSSRPSEPLGESDSSPVNFLVSPNQLTSQNINDENNQATENEARKLNLHDCIGPPGTENSKLILETASTTTAKQKRTTSKQKSLLDFPA